MYPIDTANISDGTNNHVYSLLTLGNDKAESVRAEAGLQDPLKATLTIKHSSSGASGSDGEVQSSVARFDRAVVNATTGKVGTITTYQVSRFQKNIVTDAQVKAQAKELRSFMEVAGYEDKFIDGQP